MRFHKQVALVVTLFLVIMLVPLPDSVQALTVHDRIAGANRFETAVQISQAGWDSADTVILARSDAFPDALAGAPLALYHSAPILITYSGSLHTATANEITRLGASKVIILGGTGAISTAVENTLKAQEGIDTVERIGGTNRYETAALIAAKLPAYSGAVIAYGDNFPDALAIGPYAARLRWPILLTRTNSLPSETAAALSGVSNTIIVGGTAVVSPAVEALLPSPWRLAGANRYETAAVINAQLFHERERAYVATGENFADALTGSVLAAKNDAPMLLVRKTSVPAAIDDLIRYYAYPAFTILGGEAAVSSTVYPSLQGIQHIILRVVHVTTEWMPFTELGGWTQAADIKEAHGVKFYEAAIWDDGLRVHVYAFPNDYDPFYGYWEGLSDHEKVAYRESFCIYSQDSMPAIVSERGEFILNTFSAIAEELVGLHPYASHNLIFSGHGIWGGELFGLHLNDTQANAFLGNWHQDLGRKLGFIDMGSVCLKGSYIDLDTFSEHADYYIATDLPAGGFQTNEGVDTSLTDVDHHYPRILGSHADMEDALRERVDLRRLRYEDSSIYITAEEVMQSCYLYSCSNFLNHKAAIAAFMNGLTLPDYVLDVRSNMIDYSASPSLLEAYDSIILHKADTKDFFTWPEEKNGMIWLNN